MIRKAWNMNLRISLVLMVAATFGTTAWADGTHNATFTVKNQSGGKILVYTYNGDDSLCGVAHKEYVIDDGGERTAKCHGKGKQRCKFTVIKGTDILGDRITLLNTCKAALETGSTALDQASRRIPVGADIVNKGETCTITGRLAGDYNCQ